jgi:hypothetical protein
VRHISLLCADTEVEDELEEEETREVNKSFNDQLMIRQNSVWVLNFSI